MNYVKLSKELSYVLRHNPYKYELKIDEEGWVSIVELLDGLNRSHNWKNVTLKDLEKIINSSKKKRYEIKNGKIRACYGHSIPINIEKEEKRPPYILYHGTARHFINSIMEKGLLPKGRQYVHLSQDIEDAKEVGRRRDKNPIILKVNASLAYYSGIKFYYGNGKVWLANKIPPKFLEKIK